MAEECYPLEVDYCGVCGLPPEYCEYGPDSEKCKEWLQSNMPDLYEELTQATEDLAIGEDGEEKKKRQTRGGKANKLVVKQKAAEKKVILSTEVRSKKKSVTIIKGLATFDIDPKKASKLLSNRFACGVSVSGGDEIVIQGDVADDIIDFLQEKYPDIDDDSIEAKLTSIKTDPAWMKFTFTAVILR